MNPYRTFDRDVREDAECAWHRAGINAEPSIDENGHAIVESAVCAADVDLKRARLPHRECGSNPAGWTGAALVGTRERLLDARVTRVGAGAAEKVHRPQLPVTREGIAERLINDAGLSYARGSTVVLGGWAPDYPGDFLDRMRSNGPQALSIITERLAATAVRQTWIRVDAFGCRSVTGSGATRVMRSLLDAAHAMIALVDGAIATSRPLPPNAIDERHKLAILLILRLKDLADRLDKAVARSSGNRPLRLGKWIKDACAIIDAISRFTVSPGSPIVRCEVARKLLESGVTDFSARMRWETEVATLNARVNSLDVGNNEPAWPECYRSGAMNILAMADPSARWARVEAICGDRIYRLIMSRRFDRLYQILPWVCSPSAAFPFVFGGPVGAVTQLMELARSMELALGLKQRLFDSGDTNRLDVAKGSTAFATARTIRTQVANRTRAGSHLAETAMCHHMVQALMAGKRFSGNHPLPAVISGSLDYDFSASTTDVGTATTIAETELALEVFATKGRDQDLPTYAGLTLIDMISCSVFETFGKPDKGSWFGQHRKHAADAMDPLERPSGLADINIAHRNMVLSMLKTLDIGPAAPNSKPPLLVKHTHRTAELNRLRGLIGGRLVLGQQQTAQGLRKKAGKLANRHGSRIADLRSRVAQAVSWTPACKKKRVSQSPPPQNRAEDEAQAPENREEPLASVLRGEKALAGDTLIAHCFDPVIWFRPDIDHSLIGSIASGALPGSNPGEIGVLIQAAVRAMVAKLQAKARDMRLSASEVSLRLDRTLTPFFTGLSGTTADEAHRTALTSLAIKRSANVRIVNKDERTKANVAAPARRPAAQNQEQNRYSRPFDGAHFGVQSALWSAARLGFDLSARIRIEGCRPNQRRARRRGC